MNGDNTQQVHAVTVPVAALWVNVDDCYSPFPFAIQGMDRAAIDPIPSLLTGAVGMHSLSVCRRMIAGDICRLKPGHQPHNGKPAEAGTPAAQWQAG